MTTEVAKREGGVLVPNEVGVTGAYDQDDIVTPICSIVQPSSGSERGDPGRYWFPDGYAADALADVVVLGFAGTRTLWAPKGEGDSVPACRSANRQEGMTTRPGLVIGEKEARKQNMEDGKAVYIPCEVCPHYDDDKFGSGDWLCKPGYTLLLFTEERGPFLFFVKGSAINPVKRAIISPALMRIKRGERAEPWRFLYTFNLRMTENDKGKFYVPEIQATGEVEKPEQYEEMAVQLSSNIERSMEQAVEAEDEELQQASLMEDGI